MTTELFNSWPAGVVPPEKSRPELDQVRAAGYTWSDPRDVVEIFENKVAHFAGARYGVAVDCCSHGVFLCLKYLEARPLYSKMSNNQKSLQRRVNLQKLIN